MGRSRSGRRPRGRRARPRCARAQVHREEFFKKYAEQFGFGPKDEMRYRDHSSVDAWYVQYHDGYQVEGGSCHLKTWNNRVVGFWGCGFVFGLPDAPAPMLTEARVKEIATAEAGKHIPAPSEVRFGKIEPVWRSGHPSLGATGCHLEFGVVIENGTGLCLDVHPVSGAVSRLNMGCFVQE
jgi:hypothetical protein